MTLFTKDDCKLCLQLKEQFDFDAMHVHVEILDRGDADALAHLAWHGLVETARKTLPILVLDDCSTVDIFSHIETHLIAQADRQGIARHNLKKGTATCEGSSCRMQ